MLLASEVMTRVAWIIARNAAPWGGFSSGDMRLREEEPFDKEGAFEGSGRAGVAVRSGLFASDTREGLGDETSDGSGGSGLVTSVTDRLRLFFPIKAFEEEDEGFRIEKPSVPKTLRDGLRFVAACSVLGVGGTGTVGGVSSVGRDLLAIEGDACWDSGVSPMGKDTWGVLLLLRGLIHQEPIQSPIEGRSVFTASSLRAAESKLGVAGN